MKADKGEWKPEGVNDGIWRDMKANGGRWTLIAELSRAKRAAEPHG